MRKLYESALDDIDDKDVYDDDFAGLKGDTGSYEILSPGELQQMTCFCVTYGGSSAKFDYNTIPTEKIINYKMIVDILERSNLLGNLHLAFDIRSESNSLFKNKVFDDFVDICELGEYAKKHYDREYSTSRISIWSAGLFFDIDDSKKKDINYVMKCLKELLAIILKLDKIFTTLVNPSEYRYAFLSSYMKIDNSNRNNRFTNIEHADVVLSDVLMVLNDYIEETTASWLAKLLNVVFLAGETYYTPEMVYNYFNIDKNDKLTKCITYFGRHYYYLKSLEYEFVKRTLRVIIPKDSVKDINGFDLGTLGVAMKAKNTLLQVDGTLYIMDLFDLCNLSYLDPEHMHNKLVVSCEISPKILRAILVKAPFRIIDLRRCTFTTDMSVDMNNRMVCNPECKILADEKHLTVKY